jgi:hypothetical protein
MEKNINMKFCTKFIANLSVLSMVSLPHMLASANVNGGCSGWIVPSGSVQASLDFCVVVANALPADQTGQKFSNAVTYTVSLTGANAMQIMAPWYGPNKGGNNSQVAAAQGCVNTNQINISDMKATIFVPAGTASGSILCTNDAGGSGHIVLKNDQSSISPSFFKAAYTGVSGAGTQQTSGATGVHLYCGDTKGGCTASSYNYIALTDVNSPGGNDSAGDKFAITTVRAQPNFKTDSRTRVDGSGYNKGSPDTWANTRIYFNAP